MKHVSGGGQRSPPRGGVDANAANQQLLVGDDEEDLAPSAAAGAAAEELAKGEEKRKRRRKVLIRSMPCVQKTLSTNICGALSGRYSVRVYPSWACLALGGPRSLLENDHLHASHCMKSALYFAVGGS